MQSIEFFFLNVLHSFSLYGSLEDEDVFMEMQKKIQHSSFKNREKKSTETELLRPFSLKSNACPKAILCVNSYTCKS